MQPLSLHFGKLHPLGASVFNKTLLDLITPQSVLTWVRGNVANRVATSGTSWVSWFSKQNSGTINNQWMVVDMNLFTPFMSLQSGLLTIAEQLPGVEGVWRGWSSC